MFIENEMSEDFFKRYFWPEYNYWSAIKLPLLRPLLKIYILFKQFTKTLKIKQVYLINT